MTLYEQERAAYMAGDTERAELLARIDELQRALARAVAEMDLVGVDYDAPDL